MAQFFPTPIACRFDTLGGAPGSEVRRRLPVLVQYPCRPKVLQPDIVLMHLLRGVPVVKDWKLETFQSMESRLGENLCRWPAKIQKNCMLQARPMPWKW